MTQAHTSNARVSPREAGTISIRQRSGIWRVVYNGVFYGDYTRRYWAIEAAFEKADTIAAEGGGATITIAMDGEQDALLYDTRAPSSRDVALNAHPRKTAKRGAEWPTTRRWPPFVGEAFAKRLLDEAKR